MKVEAITLREIRMPLVHFFETSFGRTTEQPLWSDDLYFHARLLEIKNAWLNIEKLGAIARLYTLNQYGSSSSPLQGGLPTDRLVAEWWLCSKRVQSLLENGELPPFKPETSVGVPAEIYAWKAAPQHRHKAEQVQARNRDQFLDAFARGLSVLGYERDGIGNGSFLLGRWDQQH